MREYGNVRFRLLEREEVKVSAAFDQEESVVHLYLYLDARTVMDILDDGVGPLNWERTHECIGNKVYCAIRVNANYDHPDKAQCFISKMDVGTKTPIEKEKGESSDSFKRAAVSWGIGRALYYAPEMNLSPGECLITKDGRVQTKFEVRQIAFTEDQRRIKDLVIINHQTGEIVYDMKDFKRVTVTVVTPPAFHTASSVTEESHTADAGVAVGAGTPVPRMEQDTPVEGKRAIRSERMNKPVCEKAVPEAKVRQSVVKPVCSAPAPEPPVCETKNPFEPVCESEEGVPFDEYTEFEVDLPEMTEAAYERKVEEIESLKAEINQLLDQKIGVTVKKDNTFREVWRNEQFINYLLNKFTPIDAATQAVKNTVIRLVANAKIVEMVL